MRNALTRWRRLPTPTAGLVPVVGILFAAEYLSQKFTPIDSDTTLIEVPNLGEAVSVDLLFGRLPDGRLALQPNQRNLGRVALTSGEEFFIIATVVRDFDATDFRQNHQVFSETTELGFLQELPHVDPDDLRGAILLPAVNDGVLRIVEIGPAYIT